MHDNHLGMPLSTITRLRALGGFTNFDHDKVWHDVSTLVKINLAHIMLFSTLS